MSSVAIGCQLEDLTSLDARLLPVSRVEEAGSEYPPWLLCMWTQTLSVIIKPNDLVRLDVKINQEPVDPLATICHRDSAYKIGKGLVKQLKEYVPRQQFKIPIQAAIGGKVIAAEALSALRKDVLAKCYGGDISRKKKLLKKQAAGKKRMKQFGRVEVPQEAFMAVLKIDKDSAGND
eukprot:scaffold276635_cov29-Prasinocladus_malaysianus.AAC.1